MIIRCAPWSTNLYLSL